MNYKVIKGEIGGFGNIIFKVGDIVSDTNFPPGNAADLEKIGFLEIVPETEKKQSNDEDDEDSELTKAEIISELKKLNISFNPTERKAVLLGILESSKIER